MVLLGGRVNMKPKTTATTSKSGTPNTNVAIPKPSEAIAEVDAARSTAVATSRIDNFIASNT